MAKKAKSQKKPDDEEIEENGEEDADEQPEFEETPDQSPAPEEVPEEGAENKEGDGEPGTPPPGSSQITIEGEGSTPIIGAGGERLRTVERGVPVEVNKEELAYLEAADIPFKKGK